MNVDADVEGVACVKGAIIPWVEDSFTDMGVGSGSSIISMA